MTVKILGAEIQGIKYPFYEFEPTDEGTYRHIASGTVVESLSNLSNWHPVLRNFIPVPSILVYEDNIRFEVGDRVVKTDGYSSFIHTITEIRILDKEIGIRSLHNIDEERLVEPLGEDKLNQYLVYRRYLSYVLSDGDVCDVSELIKIL
jgi:hypothetical protein